MQDERGFNPDGTPIPGRIQEVVTPSSTAVFTPQTEEEEAAAMKAEEESGAGRDGGQAVSRALPQRKSSLHRRVVGLIREAFPSFKVFEELAVKVQLSGRVQTLYVDIVINELNLAIECQGRQHFEFVPHFHGTRHNYAQGCERDASKASGLLAAGYSYLVIRYDEEKKLTVESLLQKITKAISGTEK